MTASRRGQLLVATPLLSDGIFDRTVVLLLEHGEEGAVGVVLNRPSDVALVDSLPSWSEAAAEPAVVFVGGPVAQGGALCLCRCVAEPVAGWERIVGDIGIVDLHLPAEAVLPTVDAVRVFTGHAGWGGGQLEDEVAAGAWLVLGAEPGDALTATPEGLWREVLRRQGGTTAWLANHPEDPSRN